MTRNYKIKAGLGVYTESQTGKAIKSAEWRVTEADLRTRKGFAGGSIGETKGYEKKEYGAA
jgi:hypothetical protein